MVKRTPRVNGHCKNGAVPSSSKSTLFVASISGVRISGKTLLAGSLVEHSSVPAALVSRSWGDPEGDMLAMWQRDAMKAIRSLKAHPIALLVLDPSLIDCCVWLQHEGLNPVAAASRGGDARMEIELEMHRHFEVIEQRCLMLPMHYCAFATRSDIMPTRDLNDREEFEQKLLEMSRLLGISFTRLERSPNVSRVELGLASFNGALNVPKLVYQGYKKRVTDEDDDAPKERVDNGVRQRINRWENLLSNAKSKR